MGESGRVTLYTWWCCSCGVTRVLWTEIACPMPPGFWLINIYRYTSHTSSVVATASLLLSHCQPEGRFLVKHRCQLSPHCTRLAVLKVNPLPATLWIWPQIERSNSRSGSWWEDLSAVKEVILENSSKKNKLFFNIEIVFYKPGYYNTLNHKLQRSYNMQRQWPVRGVVDTMTLNS